MLRNEQTITVPVADAVALAEFIDGAQGSGLDEVRAIAGRLRERLPEPFADVEKRLREAVGPYLRVAEIVRDGSMVQVRGDLVVPDAATLEAAWAAVHGAGLPVWCALWDGRPSTRGEWADWNSLGPAAPVAGPVTLQVAKSTRQ